MAVLQNMREKFGIAISIIIALSLLYFIAPMDDIMTLFGRPQNVGEIAGKGVSYEDFLAEVDKQTTISEIMSGSSVKSEQQQQQIRNGAWQEFIDRYMFLKNAKAAGIKVGEAEMIERTTGTQVSPIVAQSPIFTDQSGNFSSQAVIDFVQNIANDESGQMKPLWNYIQNSVYNQEFYAKYGALFTNSAYCNALQSEREVALNNATAKADYVFVPYGYELDSTVVVSKSDIKKYYDANKKNYKQIENRDIEYVVYEVVPSAKDIAETSDKMNAAHSEFMTTANVKNFLLKNSDRQLSDYWYKDKELQTINREVNDFVFGAANGVSPIFQDKNTFYAVKVMDTAMIPDSVYVKHILLQGSDAKAKADSLLGVVKNGESFSALAASFSADQGSAADGELGNIGWLTQSYMIPGMESVITAETGKPFILNTRYGTHVVLVSKKTAPVLKKQVAILEKTAIASKETFQENYNKVNKFAVLCGGTYEGYKKAVDSLAAYSYQLNVVESTSKYGSVEDAKEVTRKVFETKKGKATEILTVNQNYFFVAAVKDIHKEGYKTVNEMAENIRQILYTQKRSENKKAEAVAKAAGLNTLEEIAAAFGATVEADQEISFATMGPQAVEPAAVGAMFAAEDGKLVGPVAGEAGLYFFKVASREAGEFYTADDAKQMNSQKAQYASQMIIPEMLAAADVKDYRARYF